MLKLKKYFTLSALLLTLVGQMNAMDEAQQKQKVDQYVKEAQEAFKSGFYITPHFNNIVCDGDKALAINTKAQNGYRAQNMTPNFTRTSYSGQRDEHEHNDQYQLGSCKEYFTTLVAVMNNEKIRQAIVGTDRYGNGFSPERLDQVVHPKHKDNLVHMGLSGNLEKPEDNQSNPYGR